MGNNTKREPDVRTLAVVWYFQAFIIAKIDKLYLFDFHLEGSLRDN
jgi:hypothetical protein